MFGDRGQGTQSKSLAKAKITQLMQLKLQSTIQTDRSWKTMRGALEHNLLGTIHMSYSHAIWIYFY